MLIPRWLIEKELEPGEPISPKVTNSEAIQAQKEINDILKREDISSNALPSKDNSPILILLHGYASSKWLWIDPFFGTFGWLRNYQEKPKPRSYGWHSRPPPSFLQLPFTYSISPLIFPNGMFNYLMEHNIEVLTYTQKDPFGDIDISVKEFEMVLSAINKVYGEKPIIPIGHSRGGIIIRRYLDLFANQTIKKVITIGTPHKGTNLSNYRWFKQPIMKILNETKLKRFWEINGKRDVKDLKNEQMAKNSEYLLKLKDKAKNPEIDYVAIAGCCSTFAHIYSWAFGKESLQKKEKNVFEIDNNTNSSLKSSSFKTFHWIAYPKRILTIFDKTILPEFRVGDGMVSVHSALFEQATKNYKLPVNHEELVTCELTKKIILKELKKTQKNS